MRAILLVLLLTLSLSAAARRVADPGPLFSERPEYAAFVGSMAARLGVDWHELEPLFRQVRLNPQIIRTMSLPAEARPWDQYRPLFVNPRRIEGGVRFWGEHGEDLARARQRYGVPEALIVAILGVETMYGRNVGSYRVIEALTTLAVEFPPRADYFRYELEEFLRLAREQGFDALAMRGSYAGAMGIGQFMPSSWRRHGVDFDGDGRTDLRYSPSDVIGSVASYIRAHGWQEGRPVAVPVEVVGEETRELANTGWSARRPLSEWRARGVAVPQGLPEGEEAMLVRLDTTRGPEFWLAFHNYYVITRYNRSFQYALAVFQLAGEIAAARAACVAC